MTRASDTAKLLGAGATILDGTTISTADNTTQLSLTSTDADSSVGPVLDLLRDSGSPADGDAIGQIKFSADNDAGEATSYGIVNGILRDASNGTEDGQIQFVSMVNGSNVDFIRYGVGGDGEVGVIFNEGSIDADFRVESNGNANMLFVDGGNNAVVVGQAAPETTISGFTPDFQVIGTASSLTRRVASSSGPLLALAKSRNTSVDSFTVVQNGDSVGEIVFFADDGTNLDSRVATIKAEIDGAAGANDTPGRLVFMTTADGAASPTERGRITSGGKFLVGGLTTSNDSLESLQVYANGKVPLSVARQQDGTVVHFRSGAVNGATHGEISISGVTCTYGAFTGTHWSRLSDNTMPTILLGTVIENIDEMCDWYQAEFTVEATDEEDEYVRSESIGLPSGKSEGDTITHKYEGTDYTATIIKEGDNKHTKCKISDTADSKSIYGVFCAWDLDDDTVNDMKVASLGTHVVRIHKDVTVSKGDLLSSNGDGTAKVQDDDIIRSKTLGKVLTNIKQETYSDGSYTVPCALYCG